MRRDQLEHAIRTACQIIEHPAVVVVGSQSILGTFTEDELPPRYTGWCLDKADLCVAKLCALREKDQNFVAALLDAGLVDADILASRLASVPSQHQPAAERALGWLTASY